MSLNPFLDIDDDTVSSADSFFTADSPPNSPPPSTAASSDHVPCLKLLPAFWPDAAVAWFAAVVEAQIRLRRVWSQDERFCHVNAALDKLTHSKRWLTSSSRPTPWSPTTSRRRPRCLPATS